MENNIRLKINTIRRLIGIAQIEESFEVLIDFVVRIKSVYKNEVIVLYSEYNSLIKKENLGIGEFNDKKNRIILSILKILDSIEKEEKNSRSEHLDNGEIEQKVDLLEKNIDLLLNEIIYTKNKWFISLKNSSHWNNLLPNTIDCLESNNIALNDRNLDNYYYVVEKYLKAVKNEFYVKIFHPFRDKLLSEIGEEKELENELRQFEQIPSISFIYDEMSEFIKTGEHIFTLYQMCNFIFNNGFYREFGHKPQSEILSVTSFISSIIEISMRELVKESVKIRNINELERNLLHLVERTMVLEKEGDTYELIFTEEDARLTEENVIKVLINLHFKN